MNETTNNKNHIDKKQAAKRGLSLLLCLALLITGLFAFLTATDSKTNVFTIGNLKAELWENFDTDNDKTLQNDETYDASDENKRLEVETPVMPGEEVLKQPFVKNTGSNPGWTYLVVSIPTANRDDIKSDASGRVAIAGTEQEINIKAIVIQDHYGDNDAHTMNDVWTAYGYDVDGDADTASDISNRVPVFSIVDPNSSWTQIGDVINSDDGNDYYVYGYNTLLQPNIQTSIAFNAVKLNETIGMEDTVNVTYYYQTSSDPGNSGSGAGEANLSEVAPQSIEYEGKTYEYVNSKAVVPGSKLGALYYDIDTMDTKLSQPEYWDITHNVEVRTTTVINEDTQIIINQKPNKYAEFNNLVPENYYVYYVTDNNELVFLGIHEDYYYEYISENGSDILASIRTKVQNELNEIYPVYEEMNDEFDELQDRLDNDQNLSQEDKDAINARLDELGKEYTPIAAKVDKLQGDLDAGAGVLAFVDISVPSAVKPTSIYNEQQSRVWFQKFDTDNLDNNVVVSYEDYFVNSDVPLRTPYGYFVGNTDNLNTDISYPVVKMQLHQDVIGSIGKTYQPVLDSDNSNEQLTWSLEDTPHPDSNETRQIYANYINTQSLVYEHNFTRVAAELNGQDKGWENYTYYWYDVAPDEVANSRERIEEVYNMAAYHNGFSNGPTYPFFVIDTLETSLDGSNDICGSAYLSIAIPNENADEGVILVWCQEYSDELTPVEWGNLTDDLNIKIKNGFSKTSVHNLVLRTNHTFLSPGWNHIYISYFAIPDGILSVPDDIFTSGRDYYGHDSSTDYFYIGGLLNWPAGITAMNYYSYIIPSGIETVLNPSPAYNDSYIIPKTVTKFPEIVFPSYLNTYIYYEGTKEEWENVDISFSFTEEGSTPDIYINNYADTWAGYSSSDHPADSGNVFIMCNWQDNRLYGDLYSVYGNDVINYIWNFHPAQPEF